MNSDVAMAIAGALVCGGLALAVLVLKGVGSSKGFFVAGMFLLATESVCEAFSFSATAVDQIIYWQSCALIVKSGLAGVWLCFSASYSRGDGRVFLSRWKWILSSATILPLFFAFYYRSHLFELLQDPSLTWPRFAWPGKILNAILLLGSVLILMNLEQTFRSAVGTMRWRIKFIVLGIAVIFGVRIYTRSQVLLFSGYDLSLIGIESGGLLLGGALIVFGYFRSGFGEIDLYPSRAVLRTSLTILLVGGYLTVVGVLAQIATYLGGAATFRFAAFIILVGVICLALVLLSERSRRRIDLFVSRNLRRPQYDFRKLWSRFTEVTSEAHDPLTLSAVVAALFSETFRVLSVSIWLIDVESGELVLAASTAGAQTESGKPLHRSATGKIDGAALQKLSAPFDLDTVADRWVQPLRTLEQKRFREGGHQICLPLRARNYCHGLVILSDRVHSVPYTTEEFDLLGCIADQTAARLVNLHVSAQLLARKELEALQRVTAFFVHDLKNAASTLNLMLTNLPVHFADPAFREDAMRGIRNTVTRIAQLISRAGSLRVEPELKATECDLTALVAESLKGLNGSMSLELVERLAPVPRVMADPEQIQSVITNLLLNASEASGTSQVIIETGILDGWASLKVSDNGCGMSTTFIQDSLFRPFQTTKKKGLGIGMFQSKMIVEAHRGRISVTSQPGLGTTFRVLLPTIFSAS